MSRSTRGEGSASPVKFACGGHAGLPAKKKTKKGESNPLPPPRCSPSLPRGDACARPEALHVPWHSPLAFRALLVIDRLACVTPSPVPDSETAECRHPPRVWGVALKLGGRRPQRLSKPPKLGLTAWRMGTRVLGPPPRASDLLRSERYTTIHGRRRAPTTCRGDQASRRGRGADRECRSSPLCANCFQGIYHCHPRFHGALTRLPYGL